MVPPKIDKIRMYGVGRNNDFYPLYVQAWQVDGDHALYVRFQSMIRAGKPIQKPAEAKDLPRSRLFGGQPTLDIDFGSATGMHACFFRIEDEPMDQKPLLTFLPPDPFLPLPVNFNMHETLLERTCYSSSTPQWASFIFDADAARKSELAQRIIELGKTTESLGRTMRLPFNFNVIDPRLGFAPWVLPDDEHSHKHHHVHKLPPSRAFFTHGGVHPKFASFVSIDI